MALNTNNQDVAEGSRHWGRNGDGGKTLGANGRRYSPIWGALGIVGAVAIMVIAAQWLGGGNPVIAWTAVPEACSLSGGAIHSYSALIRERTPGYQTDPDILMATTTGSLITDCNSLLAARDSLQQAEGRQAKFNDWDADVAIQDWYGVVVCPRPDGVVDTEDCMGTPFDASPRVVALECVECDLREGELHAALGNLHKIRRIDLQRTGIKGAIPGEIGNLGDLQSLNLWGGEGSGYPNRLSGEIPAALGSLSSLRHLLLSDNQLSGEIPRELGELARLTQLRLDGNRLTGAVPPEIGDLTALGGLYLHGNKRIETDEHSGETSVASPGLSGALPPELGKLSRLKYLWLQGNGFSGVVPPEWADMSALEQPFLWDNPGLVTELALAVDKTAISEGDVVSAIGVVARVDKGSEWLARFWARPALSGAARFQRSFAASDIAIAPRGTQSGDVVDFTSTMGRIASIPESIPDVFGIWDWPAWSGEGRAEILIIPELDSVHEGDEIIALDVSGEGISTHHAQEGVGGRVTRLVAANDVMIRLRDNDAPDPAKTPAPKRPRRPGGPPVGLPTDPAATETPMVGQTPMATEMPMVSETPTATPAGSAVNAPTATPYTIVVDPALTVEPTQAPAGRVETPTPTATPMTGVADPGGPTLTPSATGTPLMIATPTPTPTIIWTPADTATPGADMTATHTATVVAGNPVGGEGTSTPVATPSVVAEPTRSSGGGSRPRQPTRTPIATPARIATATPEPSATMIADAAPTATMEAAPAAIWTAQPDQTATSTSIAGFAPMPTFAPAVAVETATPSGTPVVNLIPPPPPISMGGGSGRGNGGGAGWSGADSTPTPTPTATPTATRTALAAAVNGANGYEVSGDLFANSGAFGGAKSAALIAVESTPGGLARADKARLNGNGLQNDQSSMGKGLDEARSGLTLSRVNWPWWLLALLLIAAIIAWRLWRKRREDAA